MSTFAETTLKHRDVLESAPKKSIDEVLTLINEVRDGRHTHLSVCRAIAHVKTYERDFIEFFAYETHDKVLPSYGSLGKRSLDLTTGVAGWLTDETPLPYAVLIAWNEAYLFDTKKLYTRSVELSALCEQSHNWTSLDGSIEVSTASSRQLYMDDGLWTPPPKVVRNGYATIYRCIPIVLLKEALVNHVTW